MTSQPATDRYTVRVRVDATPAATDAAVRSALSDEGFGVLTEIDVKATLEAKLDVDMDDYTILGACAPPLAQQAIGIDDAIGALLPCNVVVRTHPDGGSEVIAIDAGQMLGMTGVSALEGIADDVATRLQRVLVAVSGA